MIILVVTRGSDAHAVQARRCGPVARLLVRTRSFSLDRALSHGVSPDSAVSLSLRAHALISPQHRLRLARRLRRIARAAARPRHRWDPSVPVASHVSDAIDLIEEVTEMLDGPEAVDARGVAQLEILLRDGGSPLFDARAAAALRRSLESALATLAPCSRSSV